MYLHSTYYVVSSTRLSTVYVEMTSYPVLCDHVYLLLYTVYLGCTVYARGTIEEYARDTME